MYNDELRSAITKFLDDKKHIVIVQGDNPDADSLASSLALEELLGDAGLSPYMFCSIDVANHLRYLQGWDRVSSELPEQFDAWIMVDCEYIKLLDNAKQSGALDRLLQKPLMILDHHNSPSDIDFAEVVINDVTSGATGQVIYNVARLMDWNISLPAAEFMTVSILSDTLGFNSDFLKGNSSPLRTVADLVDIGVNLSELNDLRLRQFQITPEIFRYKSELMQRVEFHYDNKIATIDIPHDEIKEYSMSYNPTVILDDARMIEGLAVGIGFKSYERNGSVFRITARIRCGFGYTIAADLASHFEGGGGHKYAAGFKVEGDNLDLSDIKRQTIQKAIALLGDVDN
jgi:bifunctional oligoribonuclease and PAP phosphatase NrnA